MATTIVRMCRTCGVRYPLDSYPIHGPSKKGRNTQCAFCIARYAKKYNKDPRRRMLISSKCRTYSKDIEHTIKLKDIDLPKTCKYLGVEIDYRQASERGTRRACNGPSIDRIDNSKGYIPGNIQTISDLANRMKQEATIDQLVAFAKGVLKEHG